MNGVAVFLVGVCSGLGVMIVVDLYRRLFKEVDR